MNYSDEVEALINKVKDQEPLVIVDDVIRQVAKKNKINISTVRKSMAVNKSEYLYSTIGFINGRPMKRTLLLFHFKKILQKIFKKLDYKNLTDDERSYILQIIEMEMINKNLKETIQW